MFNFKYFTSSIFSLFLLFLFSINSFAQKVDNSTELIKLYNAYRIVQQKKTNWIDTVDNWTGKFHNIMSQVSDTLGKPIYTKKDILNLLGNPDMVINRCNRKNTNEIYSLINKKPIIEISKREEYLIYKWRGYRDFIYFYLKSNVVQKSDWYYSWE